MSDNLRKIDDDGVGLNIKTLPEFADLFRTESRRRMRAYGGRVSGEKRSLGTYLMVAATLHFLRLPESRKTAIYAEMRSVMDQRLRVAENEPLELPAYRDEVEDVANRGGDLPGPMTPEKPAKGRRTS